MAYREDRVSLRPPRRLADGRLRADAWLTRTGVFEYVEPGGKVRREYRPPDEVFHPESLAAYEGLIVTDEHPPEPITLQNAARYRRGQTGEIARRDGDHVAAALYVDDPGLISAMERPHRPKRDLSVGYNIQYDETPGVTPDGQRYDAVQRNIRPNHVAVVEKGRAGTARVRLDSAHNGRPFEVAYQKELPVKNNTNDNGATTQALADALARGTQLQADLAKERARADAAEGRVAGLEETIAKLRSERTDSDRVAELRAEADTQKARADAAETALAQVPALVKEGVARRSKIEKGALLVLGHKDEKGDARRLDDLSDRDIMTLVIERTSGQRMDSVSDDYLRARFDASVESYGAGTAALAQLSQQGRIEQARAQEASRADSGEQRRQQQVQKRQDAWKDPLPSTKKFLSQPGQ